jgi:hypothetical protein
VCLRVFELQTEALQFAPCLDTMRTTLAQLQSRVFLRLSFDFLVVFLFKLAMLLALELGRVSGVKSLFIMVKRCEDQSIDGCHDMN